MGLESKGREQHTITSARNVSLRKYLNLIYSKLLQTNSQPCPPQTQKMTVRQYVHALSCWMHDIRTSSPHTPPNGHTMLCGSPDDKGHSGWGRHFVAVVTKPQRNIMK